MKNFITNKEFQELDELANYIYDEEEKTLVKKLISSFIDLKIRYNQKNAEVSRLKICEEKYNEIKKENVNYKRKIVEMELNKNKEDF